MFTFLRRGKPSQAKIWSDWVERCLCSGTNSLNRLFPFVGVYHSYKGEVCIKRELTIFTWTLYSCQERKLNSVWELLDFFIMIKRQVRVE